MELFKSLESKTKSFIDPFKHLPGIHIDPKFDTTLILEIGQILKK